jgi:hypothetical protein
MMELLSVSQKKTLSLLPILLLLLLVYVGKY